MLYPLIIAAILSAFCSTATARMIPPWAKDLPNWKHYKIPQHISQNVPRRSVLIPTCTNAPEPEKVTEPACPTVCIDAINDCGMRYGDCIPVCAGEKPALTPPPCPSATSGVMKDVESV